MCSRFKALREWKPGDELPLELIEGMPSTGVWAGFAQQEKLDWWLKKPGHVLAQTRDEVTEIAERSDSSSELLYGPAPEHAHLLFVLEPSAPGKNYRLAKMITTAATNAQAAYYNHPRFPLLGTLQK